ncbi:MAG: hypothetical protein U9R53_07900 [Chloroflexota bacterium]|nr:hypothetical protein [Chloroflexota bacterium]
MLKSNIPPTFLKRSEEYFYGHKTILLSRQLIAREIYFNLGKIVNVFFDHGIMPTFSSETEHEEKTQVEESKA